MLFWATILAHFDEKQYRSSDRLTESQRILNVSQTNFEDYSEILLLKCVMRPFQ